MGEVFRARDSRLDRTVAIKVLPAPLSADSRFRERFEREAKAISALSHPNICTLYDVGSHDGTDYLVMEFLEGESLAERLAKGPLPIDQVIRYGTEIADALEKAHRAGIVHRDLKPGNVVITKSGAKLLDFGLAKFSQAGSDPHAATAAMSAKPLTEEGTVLGTFQYMAPEQIEGKEADPRTDIFALGALLYEMATGKRAFEAKSRASLIASILDREPPPISAVQPLTPPALERVIRMCLHKDPDERWQSAHDVAAELKWIGESTSPPAAGRAPNRREVIAWSLVTFLLAATAASILFRRPATGRVAPLRAHIVSPEKGTILARANWSGSLTISPDARWITFTAENAEGKRMLWLRRASELTAKPIPFTENAMFPFWSPDSRTIAFFAEAKLKRIGIDGGPAMVICDAQAGRSGSWNADGVIIFEPHWRAPIHRVSAAGGKSAAITKIDEAAQETTHRWATFLPGGKHFLYLAGSHLAEDNSDRNAVYLASLDSSERRLLLHARSNVVYAAGHLLFVRDRFLLAQRFDLKNLQLLGEPRAIAENVNYDHGFLRANFAAAADGTLVYQPATAEARTTLHWLDRETARLSDPIATAGDAHTVVLSPDATRVITAEGQPSDLFLTDVTRKTRVRITSNRLNDGSPVWSPDGKRIAFSSDRHIDYDTYVMSAAQPNSERLLHRIPNNEEGPASWSPDGRLLLLEYANDRTGTADIYVAPAAGGGKPTSFIATPADERDAAFSPDGKLVAFTSDESGEREVYVTAFPGPGPKIQVSTNGGTASVWTAGNELLFFTREVGWFARVRTDPELQADPPQRIDATSRSQPFDARVQAGTIAPDGKRFLVALLDAAAPPVPIILVQNWMDEEKR